MDIYDKYENLNMINIPDKISILNKKLYKNCIIIDKKKIKFKMKVKDRLSDEEDDEINWEEEQNV